MVQMTLQVPEELAKRIQPIQFLSTKSEICAKKAKKFWLASHNLFGCGSPRARRHGSSVVAR